MLPNEETTRSDLATRPGEIEALLAVSGRDMARPLVAFLKAERLNVTLVGDAESAFEEAVLHRPNLVVIHQDLPAGGVELVRRLKANTRTHFLPTIFWGALPSSDLRVQAFNAGADAIFFSSDDLEERKARLWALLRTQALHRRHERKRESQGLALRERGQWLGTFMHDLQNAVGALRANFDFLRRVVTPGVGRINPSPTDVAECTSETHALLQQLAYGLRVMQDYECFESGRVGLKETLFSPGELLHEVCAEVRIEGPANPTPSVEIRIENASPHEPAVTGDRDLLRRSIGILVNLLRRRPRSSLVQMGVRRTEEGVAFELASNGEPLTAAEEAYLFDPYATSPRKSPIAERFELALARAIVEVHRGRLRGCEGRPTAGFTVELRSRDSLPKSH